MRFTNPVNRGFIYKKKSIMMMKLAKKMKTKQKTKKITNTYRFSGKV